MHKHHQREYFSKSVKISNIGTFPKMAEGVSRFNAVQQLLKRHGLDFLLKNCESFFVYSNILHNIAKKLQVTNTETTTICMIASPCCSLSSICCLKYLEKYQILIVQDNDICFEKRLFIICT